MTQPTGSETSTTDPAANSQVSVETSEFPPPSPRAELEILLLPEEILLPPEGKVRNSRWKQLVRIFRQIRTKGPRTSE
jgi:hypothetical protein